jgi:rare lipoprotein A
MRSMPVCLHTLLMIGVGVALLVSGCTRSVSHHRLPPLLSVPTPIRPQPGQLGIASWYGPGFQGRPTASGEQYNQNALTAAHRTLPLGSKVQVTNLTNGKSVQVRINDRGPFVRGRVIDLSRGAAGRLGIVRRGTSRVRVQVLRRGHPEEMRVSAAPRRPRGHRMQARRTRRRSFLASVWPF